MTLGIIYPLQLGRENPHPEGGTLISKVWKKAAKTS